MYNYFLLLKQKLYKHIVWAERRGQYFKYKVAIILHYSNSPNIFFCQKWNFLFLHFLNTFFPTVPFIQNEVAYTIHHKISSHHFDQTHDTVIQYIIYQEIRHMMLSHKVDIETAHLSNDSSDSWFWECQVTSWESQSCLS